ncbi:hypothetical protein HQ36_02515 [Porphyromonas gingivicanis]|uniref:NAD-dependent epimerase/dehydratase domain-containing protein n=1 Tax=Porphyromonas gingivicanis TaxID=266762 RepID=A0A0A2G7F9_9PORP|nr:NAD-dependent epimerase/dehydratase family protein [Porphyromonas gingivicanis]KGN98310.1 hypothetical protein HQ36_02515 [Porphyromonas gingivicanis]
MNFLITGIDGFVGSSLTSYLGVQHTLYGVDLKEDKREGETHRYLWDDVGDKLPQVDCVIHLAGYAKDTTDESLLSEYIEVNVGLTKIIFDWFLSSEAQTFIFFSSVKAAAPFADMEAVTEEIIPKPIGPYGVSKIRAEEILFERSEEVLRKGKKMYILRPSMIYGPGNQGNLRQLYHLVRRGIPWPFGSFENKRSFCSINNISYIVERISKAKIESGVYNVCDDEPISIRQLLSVIASTVNKPSRVVSLPKFVWRGIASLGSMLKMPFNKIILQKLTENYVVDNRRIKKVLNIKEMPYETTSEVAKTIRSFLNL